MFDARTTADDQPNEALAALPHAAARCLRACSSHDHAHAEQLRAGHNRRHVPRLHVRSEREEVRARELAREAR